MAEPIIILILYAFFRLVELRTSPTTDIATKAPQLLYQLVKDNHARSSLAGKPAFEALIPIIKEEVETGKCGM